MNFLNDSGDDSKTKENLWTMLNSNDEQNIALATQILWHIEIPEEWIAFLFSKEESPSIQELLNFKFPRAEFELAYQWFSLQDERSRVGELDLLKKIVPLHKGFDWKYVLKLCVGMHSGFPYHIGKYMGDDFNHIDARSVLFNDSAIPKTPLIEACLYNNNNYLDLRESFIKELPTEIGMFPNITGISTWSDITEVPFSITYLNNLIDLNLKHNDYESLHINGLSFVEVLKEYNPALLIQLELHKILNSYNSPNVLEGINPLLKLAFQENVEENLRHFLEVLKLFFEGDYEISYLKLKDLYENRNFYHSPIGHKLSNFVYIFRPRIEFLVFSINFLEKIGFANEKDYSYINLEMILFFPSSEESQISYKLCKKFEDYVQNPLYKQIFIFFQVVFAVKLQNDDKLYHYFLERCFHYGFDELQNFKMGFLTFNDLFIQIEDNLKREEHRKNKRFAPLLAEFQHYTLTIDNQ